MDLLRVLRSARRHWVIMLLGVLIGVVFAVAVTYRVTRVAGRVRLEERSVTVYQAQAQLLISEPGYGMGSAGVLKQSLPNGFGKTQAMAPVYAQLILSDAVMQTVSRRMGGINEQVAAEAVKGCPFVDVTVTGTDPERLRRLPAALVGSLSQYLVENQDRYGVPEGDRLTVSILAQPGAPVPQQSRGFEMALLAMMSPLAAAVGVALVLDRRRHGPSGSPEEAPNTGGATACLANDGEAPGASAENESQVRVVHDQYELRARGHVLGVARDHLDGVPEEVTETADTPEGIAENESLDRPDHARYQLRVRRRTPGVAIDKRAGALGGLADKDEPPQRLAGNE